MIDQPHWRRLLLRSEEAALKYEESIRNHTHSNICNLCNDNVSTLKEFSHFKLMKNKFPYDRYFTKSDMLVSKRHVAEHELTEEERAELIAIKKSLSDSYDSIIEHLPKQKSIPDHYHVHIVEFKRPK
jgi:hypothetical protein